MKPFTIICPDENYRLAFWNQLIGIGYIMPKSTYHVLGTLDKNLIINVSGIQGEFLVKCPIGSERKYFNPQSGNFPSFEFLSYARQYFNWHNVSFDEHIEPENILSFYRIRAALKAGFMVRDWSGQLIKKVLELDGLPIAIRSNKHLYEIFHKPFTVNELKWEDFINISTYYWDEETKSLQVKEKREVEETMLPPTLPSLDEYPLEALLANIQNRFGNV